jgi:hypothetical protein
MSEVSDTRACAMMSLHQLENDTHHTGEIDSIWQVSNIRMAAFDLLIN